MHTLEVNEVPAQPQNVLGIIKVNLTLSPQSRSNPLDEQEVNEKLDEKDLSVSSRVRIDKLEVA